MITEKMFQFYWMLVFGRKYFVNRPKNSVNTVSVTSLAMNRKIDNLKYNFKSLIKKWGEWRGTGYFYFVCVPGSLFLHLLR